MAGYASIAVNVPSLAGVFIDPSSRGGGASGTFDYSLPPMMQGSLQPGHLVLVPFGNKTVQGVVVSLHDQPAVPETKRIIALVDPSPVLAKAQLSLAVWMSSQTLAHLGGVIGLFLPPGLVQHADTQYELDPHAGGALAPRQIPPAARRLVRLLQQRGPLRGRQLDKSLGRVEWRRSAQTLARKGLIRTVPVLPPASVRAKYVRTAQLAVSPEAARAAFQDLGTTASTQTRRQAALEYLIRILQPVEVAWVYAESGCNLADLQELAARDLIVLREQEVWRDPLRRRVAPKRDDFAGAAPITLTAEQEQAWRRISEALDDPASTGDGMPILLHGVTGSGKTELYLRAARKAADQGRRSIILVPEIALTPQTVQRFMQRFPGQVGLLHSGLSDGERYDTWRRARLGLLQVVIGPRSALFSPLPSVGLVVVDECHDSSFHQSEPPFYDAAAAAEAYARECRALCILGSATPSVVQSYRADRGDMQRLQLRTRLAAASQESPSPALDLPAVHVVDMREELKRGNRSSFSRELVTALSEVLRRGEQAILFLNRRGTATHVFCRTCGHVVRCPRCEAPLTMHTAEGERLVCHRCGYERKVPPRCPECGSAEIRAYGLGTEKVESEIQRGFPQARTLRWDRETTRRKEAHELILHHFASGQADVLIGTQMLAKGLDLPRVTLVGIVLADVGLFLPDPFAAERTFQVLTQVAGRAGRSALGGRVVLQTFAPSHYAIQAAMRHDAEGFHEQELVQRRRLGYPPFTRLLRLEFRHHDRLKAEDEAKALAEALEPRITAGGMGDAGMIGPAPCFFSKLDGRYRWQIVLRSARPGEHLQGLRLTGWRIEMDPLSLL